MVRMDPPWPPFPTCSFSPCLKWNSLWIKVSNCKQYEARVLCLDVDPCDETCSAVLECVHQQSAPNAIQGRRPGPGPITSLNQCYCRSVGVRGRVEGVILRYIIGSLAAADRREGGGGWEGGQTEAKRHGVIPSCETQKHTPTHMHTQTHTHTHTSTQEVNTH